MLLTGGNERWADPGQDDVQRSRVTRADKDGFYKCQGCPRAQTHLCYGFNLQLLRQQRKSVKVLRVPFSKRCFYTQICKRTWICLSLNLRNGVWNIISEH